MITRMVSPAGESYVVEDNRECVYLVVHPDRTWLAGVHLDEQQAHTHARSIQGVVASVPITGDYREQEGKPG